MNVGQTVAFTASATDTNQTSANAHVRAALARRMRRSTPTAARFRSVRSSRRRIQRNNFSLVSDNGTPSLSATQSFAVVVNPLTAPTVSDVSVVGGQFSFSISGQSGPDYAVETSTNLTQWSTAFITNSPALPLNWTDTNAAAPDAVLPPQTRPAATVSANRWLDQIEFGGRARRSSARRPCQPDVDAHG